MAPPQRPALPLLLLLLGATRACLTRSSTTDIAGHPYSLVARDDYALCPVHDPALIREPASGNLFLFSTDAGGLPIGLNLRTSTDNGTTWASAGRVFNAVPAWALRIVLAATNIWAPDVSFFAGLFHVYYAVSSFGSETSVIGLATSPTLTAPQWTDRGLVFRSDKGDGFNAIDPNVFIDAAAGTVSLIFGSFWSGIKLVALSPATGLVINASAVTALAQRQAPDALEGGFLVRRGSFHYLFASFDYCCRGIQSNYSVHVGRSLADAGPAGPFFDRTGMSMLDGGGSLLLRGGHGWAAGGGQSLLVETVREDSPVSTMVLHAYDGVSGDPFVQLVELNWSADDWPSVS